LDLLAASTVASEKSRQPYFAKARMAAAGLLGAKTMVDVKQQESLLREALAIEPDGSDSDAIRVGLFHAEAGLGQNALAIASVKPLIAQLEGTVPTSEVQDADAAETDAAKDDEDQPDAVPTKPTALMQDVEERAGLLVAISDVSWKMDDSASSVEYLQTAVRLSPKSPLNNAWQRKLADRRAALRRARANTARRPVVHATVEQSVVVRPRLLVARRHDDAIT